jgi:hypothetical protein
MSAIGAKLCATPLVCGTASSLCYPDRHFDAVTCLEVLEHLPYRAFEMSLKELERVARSYIIVSVPFRERTQYATCDYCSCRFSRYYHVRQFDERKIETLFYEFQLMRCVLAGKQDRYPLAEFAGRIASRIRGTRQPLNTVCPQCGFRPTGRAFRGPNPEAALSTSIRREVKAVLTALWPRQTTATWAIALYCRNARTTR